MVRHLETLSASLWRLLPKLPADASPAGVTLFTQLRHLLHVPADEPHEIEALLRQWFDLEERARSASSRARPTSLKPRLPAHGARRSRRPSSTARSRRWEANRSRTPTSTCRPPSRRWMRTSTGRARRRRRSCRLLNLLPSRHPRKRSSLRSPSSDGWCSLAPLSVYSYGGSCL